MQRTVPVVAIVIACAATGMWFAASSTPPPGPVGNTVAPRGAASSASPAVEEADARSDAPIVDGSATVGGLHRELVHVEPPPAAIDRVRCLVPAEVLPFADQLWVQVHDSTRTAGSEQHPEDYPRTVALSQDGGTLLAGLPPLASDDCVLTIGTTEHELARYEHVRVGAAPATSASLDVDLRSAIAMLTVRLLNEEGQPPARHASIALLGPPRDTAPEPWSLGTGQPPRTVPARDDGVAHVVVPAGEVAFVVVGEAWQAQLWRGRPGVVNLQLRSAWWQTFCIAGIPTLPTGVQASIELRCREESVLSALNRLHQRDYFVNMQRSNLVQDRAALRVQEAGMYDLAVRLQSARDTRDVACFPVQLAGPVGAEMTFTVPADAVARAVAALHEDGRNKEATK